MTNLDLQFTLAIPVWAGGGVVEIPVEICVGLKDGVPDFWLESVELQERIDEETEAIFDLQLERLSAFAIIRQY